MATAITIITSAPPATRANTAPPGDHPDSMRDFANGPETPNVAADSRAKIKPLREFTLSPVRSKSDYDADIRLIELRSQSAFCW